MESFLYNGSMYLEAFQVQRDGIPVQSYTNGQTVYYQVNPKASFDLSFDSDAEITTFHEWLLSVQGQGFIDPRLLSEKERESLAAEASEKIIKRQDKRIKFLANKVDELQGKIKAMEEEKERQEKEKRQGSISSLEL
jgi:hypothetical protein